MRLSVMLPVLPLTVGITAALLGMQSLVPVRVWLRLRGADTVTVLEAVLLQPSPSVTVTVYVVIAVGLTFTAAVAAVPALLLHRYVWPPLAVRVSGLPAQMLFAPVILATGVGAIFTVTFPTALFPQLLVTVTVYSVAVERLGVVMLAVVAPVLQRY
jgi:L-aminopeptidase/D-esterase-like protein